MSMHNSNTAIMLMEQIADKLDQIRAERAECDRLGLKVAYRALTQMEREVLLELEFYEKSV